MNIKKSINIHICSLDYRLTNLFYILFIILHYSPRGRLYYPCWMVKEHEFQGDSDLPQKHMASLYTRPWTLRGSLKNDLEEISPQNSMESKQNLYIFTLAILPQIHSPKPLEPDVFQNWIFRFRK